MVKQKIVTVSVLQTKHSAVWKYTECSGENLQKVSMALFVLLVFENSDLLNQIAPGKDYHLDLVVTTSVM